MTPQDIRDQLRHQPFIVFDVVTSSGDRYRIRHPELAQLTPTRSLYIFDTTPTGEVVLEYPTVVSVMHIVAIEPVQEAVEQIDVSAAADQ